MAKVGLLAVKLVLNQTVYLQGYIESRLQKAFVCLCIPRWLDLLVLNLSLTRKQYTAYNIYLTLCHVQYTLYSIKYTLHIIHYTLYIIQYTVLHLYTIHYIFFTMQYTIYKIQYTVCTLRCLLTISHIVHAENTVTLTITVTATVTEHSTVTV